MCKYKKGEKVNDKAVYDVDQYIDKMVAENVQFAKFVIEGKGKIYNGPGFEKLLKRKIIR